VTTVTQPPAGGSRLDAPTGPDSHRVGRRNSRRWTAALRPARTLFDLSLIVGAVLLVGARAHAFSGFPKGNDVWGHLSKTQFVLDNWPHVSWNYEWYSGMPSFQGSYPPGYHFLVALVAHLGGTSVATAMTRVALVGVVAVVIGVYGTVRSATANRAAALAAAALLIGAPTFWAQVVTLGLYPRLLGLSCASLALAGATRLAVRGGRLTALGTALALALALSMHPVVGVGAVVLVGAVLLLGPRPTMLRRSAQALGVLGLSSALASYFYLPLFLVGRSQSPWTDHEKLLSWRALVWPADGSLNGLTPLLLLPGTVVAVLAVRALLRPRVPFADKAALGVGVSWFSSHDVTEPAPPHAAPSVLRYAAWRHRVAVAGFPLRVALLVLLGVPLVLAYGSIGYVIPGFRFYVNGLQPDDLLVYPAWLLSTAIGLGLGAAWILFAGHRLRLVRTLRLAGPPVVAAAVLIGLVAAAAIVPSGTRENDGSTDRTKVSMLPSASAAESSASRGQHQLRLATASDSTSNFVNAVSAIPQTRGYQDHGNIALDYQVWFERNLLGTDGSAEVRRFMMDWYGVGWVFADEGSGPLSLYRGDPATFAQLKLQHSYTTLATFRVKQPAPILTARTTPTALVIGDQAHYGLVLRALAAAGVASRQLVTVHGPDALDDVDLADLRRFDTVLVYGAQLRSPGDVAHTLKSYVRGGGRLVVDDSELDGVAQQLADTRQNPLPIKAIRRFTVVRTWDWTVGDDVALQGIDTAAFGPPSFAGSGVWAVEAGTPVSGARALLTSGTHVVSATRNLGAGRVTWSGMALPYHAAVFQSADEGTLLGRLLSADASPAPDPPQKATFVNSERREVTAGPDAHGVLLKEHLAPDWHATVNGREVPLWSAGPGLMWVSLPEHHGDVRVVFAYRLGSVEKTGYGLSGLALLVTLALALSGRLWRRMLDTPNHLV
jgi:hypothetical protein